jgi:chlorobactene glucosyltransferase
MLLLLLSIAWALTIAGLLTRAITQYRHYEMIGPDREPLEQLPPLVTVIIPARNEADNIARCINALRNQDYPAASLRVLVIDDNSQDDTADIVSRIALAEDRVQLIRGTELPEGWLGKPHACWQGAGVAQGEWLCFIDADTTAQPALIGTAVQAARRRDVGMLSLQPVQELGTAWERLILPAGFFLIAFTQDLRKTADPSTPEAAVNGQFLLIRRTAYDAAGGHAAVRNAFAEDSALARAVNAAGHRVAVIGTEGLLHTRMYTSLRSLWDGVARQAGTLLGRSGLIIAALGALLLACAPLVLPIWALEVMLSGGGTVAAASLGFALLGSLALLGTHLGAARYFKIPMCYGLVFPVSYLLGAGVLGYSFWQLSRRGVRWKGRVYTTEAAAKAMAGA